MSRELDVLFMVRGLRQRVREVREDISEDHGPIVTHRLWKAEQQLAHAEEAIVPSGTFVAPLEALKPPNQDPPDKPDSAS